MNMKLKTLVAGSLIAGSIFASTLALAADAGDVQAVSLTVYNGDLALIREVRPVSFEQGTQVVTLKDVSGQLRPDTVHLDTPGLEGVQLLEQNYDYDLVSTSKLLQRFIGQQITLVNDADHSVLTGTLLSTADGIVILSDGQIMLNPPGRIVLPGNSADDLLLRPTLSWLLSSPQAKSTNAGISYLSGGLSWEASYVLNLAADDRSAGLEGWVTMSNYSGTTYKDAQLKLVAGDVNRVQKEIMGRFADMAAEAEPAPAPPPQFAEQDFFEYHLYELQRPTTIRNNQQKQVGLLSAQDVPVNKIYELDASYQQEKANVRVVVEVDNKKENGLGMPLPAGTVRVYKEDKSGAPNFAGEDRIQHTARNDKLKLGIGNAFDINGEIVQTGYKDLGDGTLTGWKVTVKNRKENEAVTVRVVNRSLWGDWEIQDNTGPAYTKENVSTAAWNVSVPADKEVTFTYNVRTWTKPRQVQIVR
jgi:hypothetical protein